MVVDLAGEHSMTISQLPPMQNQPRVPSTEAEAICRIDQKLCQLEVMNEERNPK